MLEPNHNFQIMCAKKTLLFSHTRLKIDKNAYIITKGICTLQDNVISISETITDLNISSCASNKLSCKECNDVVHIEAG